MKHYAAETGREAGLSLRAEGGLSCSKQDAFARSLRFRGRC